VRATARLNPTVAALMCRGLDSGLAEQLHRQGHTLGSLKARTAEDLSALGLNAAQSAAIHAGARAEIPFATLARVLWASRWTCCACRRTGLAVIVHHIRPWAKSRDHSEANLVVLCLEHHAQAHRRVDLERNLDPALLADHKTRWEAEVTGFDARAVLDAAALPGHHWLWFNHLRLLDLAKQLGIPLTRTASFLWAHEQGFVDAHGMPKRNREPFVASGGDGNYLLDYLRSVFYRVIKQTALFNISDDLDRGFLARVIQPGHLVLVQGRHVFKKLTSITEGPGQATAVRRKANGVEVSFVIDRWEAIATSSWGLWLQGAQNVASIVRVIDVEPSADGLHIKATGLAMGLALEGLASRSYLGFQPELEDTGTGFDPLAWLDA